MYNKLFTKILDSSVWLESTPTRLVWITMIAAMDETGFVAMASPENVARRAILPLDQVTAAILRLEGPDEHSSNPDHDGRRIERVPGGWVVLNAEKYRDLITREVMRASNRERVRRHREKKRSVTTSNAESVTSPITKAVGNGLVMQSEAVTETDRDTETAGKKERPPAPKKTGLRPFRQSALSGHVRCPAFTSAACARGLCLPTQLWSEWMSQLGGDWTDADKYIGGLVDQALTVIEPGPIGDTPYTFWRAVWRVAHASQAPQAQRTSGYESLTAQALRAAREVLQ